MPIVSHATTSRHAGSSAARTPAPLVRIPVGEPAPVRTRPERRSHSRPLRTANSISQRLTPMSASMPSSSFWTARTASHHRISVASDWNACFNDASVGFCCFMTSPDGRGMARVSLRRAQGALPSGVAEKWDDTPVLIFLEDSLEISLDVACGRAGGTRDWLAAHRLEHAHEPLGEHGGGDRQVAGAQLAEHEVGPRPGAALTVSRRGA